jgi:hypothetical protein
MPGPGASIAGPGVSAVQSFLRNNGLSITLFGLFVFSITGQALTGWHVYLQEAQKHGLPGIGLAAYLSSGHFVSSVFENWESEFLQMAAYVLLTCVLFQKGSPESKKLDEHNPENDLPELARNADAPWPVRQGGFALKLYKHSLGLALTLSFILSFTGHWLGSNRHANEEALRHGEPAKTLTETIGDAEFWFESFQNWQSEFLSIAVLVIFSIYLRQYGSPESKPVAAPHDQTGH